MFRNFFFRRGTMDELRSCLTELADREDASGAGVELNEALGRACRAHGNPAFDALPPGLRVACSISGYGFTRKFPMATIVEQLSWAFDLSVVAKVVWPPAS